jgi:hypothetical protein
LNCGEIMNARISLVGIFTLLSFLAGAAPHQWSLKSGEHFSGDYLSSGTSAVVFRVSGTNCIVKISDLSTNDQLQIAQLREAREKSRQEDQTAKRQAWFDEQAKRLSAHGQIEFTVDLMKNFPEKLKSPKGDQISKDCWMDAEFVGVDSAKLLSLTQSQEESNKQLSRIAGQSFESSDWRDDFLGFKVKDKGGSDFDYCFASKRMQVAAVILKLNRGDKVRILGDVSNLGAVYGGDSHQIWLQATDVQVITQAPKSND